MVFALQREQSRKKDVKSLHKIGRKPCGQSYKQFTIVIYDSRVVIWGNFKSGMTLES